MSFGQDEEELDWGDAVDVVSLGDEDEIPCIAAAEENIGEETAPMQDEDFESAAMSTKSPAAAPSHPLGLSHLPPKPQPALRHRRSREMIKASSMSRAYPRANSPGAGDDLPRHWEGPAEWPERAAPDQQQRPSARDKSPPRQASPPRQRSPNPPRQRSDSSLQPAPPRAMSPSSMLLPRRGASPARGLAKSTRNPQRTDPDVNISSDPQDNRNGRSRDSGWEQRGRNNNGRERDMGRSSARMDHYSPPPETGDSPPRRGSRHRSISPPRKAPMRSDAMIINQRGTFYCDARRSLSPRDRMDHYSPPPETGDSPPRRGSRHRSISPPRKAPMRSDAMIINQRGTFYCDARRSLSPRDRDDARGREYPVDLRRGAEEYHDPREDHFRANSGRNPNQFPPAPEPTPHPRDSASFSPHTEDTGYPAPPPGKFRDARFVRPENRRTQSSRSVNVRSARIEPQDNDPRLSPVALRNEMPLPPRHDFIPPRDGASSNRRARNGDRMVPEDRSSAIDHESIPPPHMERELHPDDLAESRESDFRSRDREPERYPPKGRREQHEPYPRGLRQDDSMSRAYEAPSVPHARRIVPRDSETLAPGRIYPPTESQRPPSPVPAVREAYSRRYVRDDQFSDHPPRDWDHEDEVPTPPEEARHVERKSQQGARRAQREAVSDTEYVDVRGGGRSRRRGEGPPSRFEKTEVEARPNFKRHATRDDNQPYEPEGRQWTPRDVHPPLPHVRSPAAQMEVDPPLVPLPEKQLAGWADFRRRRERSPERRESYHPRAGARDSWHPAPNEDQDMDVELIEGGKRQRIEGGTRMTQHFNRGEEDLPRKVPQHSPSQRPKIYSPTNSLLKLPPSALTVQPVVDFQAAVSRAKDVASQLIQAKPQHKPRPKSRFDQPSDANSTTEREINRGLVVSSSSSGAFGAANTSETAVSSEANGRSSPDEINGGRHGSEGSHSSHIVSRMDETSLRDSGYPQTRADRHRDSRPDTGPSRRDWNRSDRNGRNNGEKLSQFGDFYRPGDDTPGRGPGGMRAWGNPEVEPHRDPPPHTSTPTNRVYRNTGDRGFARPHVVISPEGLPPRPPTPTEFARGARNYGQVTSQVRSPPGKAGRSFTMTDADTAHTAPNNETDPTSPTGFTFRQTPATSPRKYSLLDRMTDPNSGAPLTVPPKDRGNGQQQNRRPRSNRAGTRR
ncbi:unnamed protein product [Rhizoctonia solani]|uniref:Uncharacterized protein n=1 Tax=Rhizoctonia solani TaxID=456999 RepID=A0A8H3H727_9AGAM|nr:unnamed protein product [Rhizoctonia solani]